MKCLGFSVVRLKCLCLIFIILGYHKFHSYVKGLHRNPKQKNTEDNSAFAVFCLLIIFCFCFKIFIIGNSANEL